jgi:predicted transcriptional regulator
MTTEGWPSEISYKINNVELGTVVCEAKTGDYSGHYGLQPSTCNLPGGFHYNIVCNDSWHDGWNGGFLKIDGVEYCNREDFPTGRSHTVPDFYLCDEPLEISQK